MPIDDIPSPNRIVRYTPDPLPAAIYVASGNSVSTLTTPYESQYIPPLLLRIQTLIIPSWEANMNVAQRKNDTAIGASMEKYSLKTGYIAPFVLFVIGFITDVDLLEGSQIWGLDLLKIDIVWPSVQSMMCFPPFSPLLQQLNSFLCFFSSCSLDPTMFQPICMFCLKLWPCLVFISYLIVHGDNPTRQVFYTEYMRANKRFS